MSRLNKPHNLDQAFKDKLQGYEEKPSDLLWFGIEPNLKVNLNFSRILKWTGVGMIGILAIIGSVYLVQDIANPLMSEAEPAKVLKVETPIVKADIPTISIIESKATPELIDLTKSQPVEEWIISQPITSSSPELNLNQGDLFIDQVITDFLASYDEMEELEGEIPDRIENNHTQDINQDIVSDADYQNMVLKEASSMKGFHVSPVVGVNNTWILNSEPYESPTGNSIDYKPKFGAFYGFSVGYDFSSSSGIQLDYIVNSSEGQSYRLNGENGELNENINLNYTRIPLVFKYKVNTTSSLSSPSTLNYLLGLQYGRLNSVIIDKEIDFHTPEDFTKHEWGVVFGLEYDMYIGRNYFVSLGGRGSVNTDVHNFPFFANNELNSPYNLFFGVTARFNYRLKSSR